MILKTQRAKLKKTLKRGWVDRVLLTLKEKKVLDKKGKQYEKTFISHVFNGRNSNDAIENAIFEVAKEQKEELAKMRVERAKYLE